MTEQDRKILRQILKNQIVIMRALGYGTSVMTCDVRSLLEEANIAQVSVLEYPPKDNAKL